MESCGFRWHYDPVYAHPRHANHVCNVTLGLAHEYHECECGCWINASIAGKMVWS
jgi:hypothetical protein